MEPNHHPSTHKVVHPQGNTNYLPPLSNKRLIVTYDLILSWKHNMFFFWCVCVIEFLDPVAASHALSWPHRSTLWPDKYQFPSTFGLLSQTKPQSFQLLLLLVWSRRRGSCTNMDEWSLLICVVAWTLQGVRVNGRWHNDASKEGFQIWTSATMPQCPCIIEDG